MHLRSSAYSRRRTGLGGNPARLHPCRKLFGTALALAGSSGNLRSAAIMVPARDCMLHCGLAIRQPDTFHTG